MSATLPLHSGDLAVLSWLGSERMQYVITGSASLPLWRARRLEKAGLVRIEHHVSNSWKIYLTDEGKAFVKARGLAAKRQIKPKAQA